MMNQAKPTLPASRLAPSSGAGAGQMNYRRLGETDIAVSEISLGCWTLGGLNWTDGEENGWAPVDESEIAAAVKAAIDAGLNHFDNADLYGNGEAERLLARVLKRLGLRSEDFIIATKMGYLPGSAKHAYEPAHIRHQCEQSLINLGRDYIDIYYFHRPHFGEDDEYLSPAAECLDSLVQEGKVRVKGQSAYSAEAFRKIVPVVRPTVLQSWANLLDDQFVRPGSPVNRLLEEHRMSFVAFGPLAQGLIFDKYDPQNPPRFDKGDHRRESSYFTTEGLTRLRPKLRRLKELFGDSPENMASVALRYVLNHPRVAAVIPGFRNRRQVNCNLNAAARRLSSEDMDVLRKIFHNRPFPFTG